jgi:isoleucyl-tRNA synthetase
VRKVLLTYWNTVAFHVLYANLANWTPGGEAPADRPRSEQHCLDRWALSEAHRLVGEVTEAMEGFDTQRAGSLLSAYVDDLSNWYVRRSRRRFWDGDDSAFATLHECLQVVTQLMAPLAPFITERVWRDLFAMSADAATNERLPESVHLSSWPEQDASLVDAHLGEQMKLARRLVELGRAARAEAKVRTRQPLRRALVATSAHDRLPDELRREVAEELNIGGLEPLSAAGADLVDHTAKGNFRALGKRFAKDTPRVAAAIAAADAEALSAALAHDGRATVELDGGPVEVHPDEVIISERPREGWSVVNEQGETVALDLEITPELRRAGLAREVVRMIQEARKGAGFEVSDRIALTWAALDREGTGEVAEALSEHGALIAEEVLASTITRAESPDGLAQRDPDLGIAITVERS